MFYALLSDSHNNGIEIMEQKKRIRGNALHEVLTRISPEQYARTVKQMAIAARIADALDAKGWSKGEFANRMSQRPSVISRWLSGTHNFTMDTLSDIEEMLGVQLLAITETLTPDMLSRVTHTS